ncbi:hypothetical protein [Maribellus mangrovi]|uniref:hypothetical protein n=1 Tax=Maribellus mangrovi TaxID=3133146 RepID=UPI0030EC6F05
MKTIYLLFALIFIAYAGFAQDTIPGQVIRVDTVKIQQVRVDTVYVPQKTAQPQAQQTNENQQPEENVNDKVYFGGYGNFSIGKYTSIGFEPLIAYKLLPRFSVGAKISYEYFKNKNYTPKKEGSNYGVGAFSRLLVTRRIYAHVEFSEMNYKLYNDAGDKNRQWISFLYVGGGYSLPISKGVSLNAEVLWDVLQNDDSPYKTVEPFFNVGIAVGF